MVAAVGANGFKYMIFRKIAGVSGATFLTYMNELMNRLPPNRRHCFLYDNLNSHLTDQVFDDIITTICGSSSSILSC